MTGLPVKRSIKIISVKDVSRKKLALQKESIELQYLKKNLETIAKKLRNIVHVPVITSGL